MKKIEEKVYINFEDVLIKPCVSSINSRKNVDLKLDIYNFNKKDYFKNWKPIPIMSANMDTVTDVVSAFELLKKNWIAVLHKYVSLNDIQKIFDKIDYYNSKILSLNEENITNSDLLFLEENGMVEKLDLSEFYHLTQEEKNSKIDEYNKYVKTIVGKLSEKKYLIDYRNLFISRGTSEEDKKKLEIRLFKEKRIQSVCIDVANGYRTEVFEYIKELKNGLCKNKILMVGNVATYDAVKIYSTLEVDIVKCGIGPGSACTTRIQTGVGVPQIGMILEIKENLEKDNISNILICSDGGCKEIGDISKAFVAGAEFVMLGGMLAGHKENPGTIEEVNGKKVKRFSGMAAKESQWNGIPTHGVHEGKTVMIPYKGKIKNTIFNIEGGIRSTCTYTNSKNIEELILNANLIKVTVQENKKFS